MAVLVETVKSSAARFSTVTVLSILIAVVFILSAAFRVAAVPAAGADATPKPAAAVAPSPTLLTPELELALAADGQVYLKIDLAQRVISVRVRGRSVEHVPVDGFLVLRAGRLTESPLPLELPVVWRVAQRPPSHRQLSTPAQLRADEPGPEEPLATAIAAEGTPPRAAYTVLTRQGWQIDLRGSQPSPSVLVRWRQAVLDGWNRLDGRAQPKPDRLVLLVSPDGAARLHHLFRQDTGVLVVAPGS